MRRSRRSAIDALALKGAGGFVDALVMPLVALALLWVTVTLPKTLARMAMFGALSGGFVGRDRELRRRAPRRRRARAGACPRPWDGQRTSTPQAAVAATTVDGEPPPDRDAPATAGGRRSASAIGDRRDRRRAATVRRAQRRDRTPPDGRGRQRHVAAPALRSPSWQEIEDRVPVEQATAARPRASTTPADVAGAMRALRPDARQGVIELMERKDGQIRGEMTHQAARGDLNDIERDAFRTLAAATPAVRAQGIANFLARPPADQPARSTPGGESSPRVSAVGPTGTDPTRPADQAHEPDRRSQ